MCIALHPLQNWVGFGGSDGTFKLKNLNTLSEQNVRAHTKEIKTLVFMQDGKSAFTSGQSEIIKWNLKI